MPARRTASLSRRATGMSKKAPEGMRARFANRCRCSGSAKHEAARSLCRKRGESGSSVQRKCEARSGTKLMRTDEVGRRRPRACTEDCKPISQGNRDEQKSFRRNEGAICESLYVQRECEARSGTELMQTERGVRELRAAEVRSTKRHEAYADRRGRQAQTPCLHEARSCTKITVSITTAECQREL